MDIDYSLLGCNMMLDLLHWCGVAAFVGCTSSTLQSLVILLGHFVCTLSHMFSLCKLMTFTSQKLSFITSVSLVAYKQTEVEVLQSIHILPSELRRLPSRGRRDACTQTLSNCVGSNLTSESVEDEDWSDFPAGKRYLPPVPAYSPP